MRSLGAAHLLVIVVLVVLVLDSRRVHTLARSTVRGRRGAVSAPGIPAGANPDQVGLPLRQIQMRTNVDWQDGGLAWEGPEILPVDEPDVPESAPNRMLPVLWKPFPLPGMLLCPDLFPRVLDPDGGAHGVFQQEERDGRAGVCVGGARPGDAGSGGA